MSNPTLLYILIPFRGGGPPPEKNLIYESLLAAIAPEARDGVKGQAAEANPMGGSQTESSQSSQVNTSIN